MCIECYGERIDDTLVIELTMTGTAFDIRGRRLIIDGFRSPQSNDCVCGHSSDALSP